MRIVTGFLLSITTLLLPTVTVADPGQNSATANAQPATASTATQAQAVDQAPAAPSQPATGASAQTGPETVVVRADKVDLDQVVCKEEPPKTGSRFGRGRECYSQREWNRRMHESQDATRKYQILGYH